MRRLMNLPRHNQHFNATESAASHTHTEGSVSVDEGGSRAASPGGSTLHPTPRDTFYPPTTGRCPAGFTCVLDPTQRFTSSTCPEVLQTN